MIDWMTQYKYKIWYIKLISILNKDGFIVRIIIFLNFSCLELKNIVVFRDL